MNDETMHDLLAFGVCVTDENGKRVPPEDYLKMTNPLDTIEKALKFYAKNCAQHSLDGKEGHPTRRKADEALTALRQLKAMDVDETCVLKRPRKRGFYTEYETVICGQSIVERYLRAGYQFDWEATDEARKPSRGLIRVEDEEKKREALEWKLIETAPKIDGKKILLAKFVGHPDHESCCWWVASASWSDKWKKFWDGIEPCGFAQPTHWMEIPKLAAYEKLMEGKS